MDVVLKKIEKLYILLCRLHHCTKMDVPILNKRWCAPNIVMKNIVESVVKVSFSFLLFLSCFRKHTNCHAW
jgi:hypothetical protein